MYTHFLDVNIIDNSGRDDIVIQRSNHENHRHLANSHRILTPYAINSLAPS